MAYNFPVGYQPYYPQQYQPQNQTSPLIWVQGEAGAKSYLLAPGNTVALWDSEKQTIYLKSADASGMPSMKILDYKIRDAAQQAQPQVMSQEKNYVTKTELTEFEQKINARIAELRKEGTGESAV